MKQRIIQHVGLWVIVLGMFLLTGCETITPGTYKAGSDGTFQLQTNASAATTPFALSEQTVPPEPAPAGQVKSFSSTAYDASYRLGPGDRFSFLVRGRPEISREDLLVAPDGDVALPRVGIINVKDKTLVQVTEMITTRLKQYYDDPDVTLVMSVFNNNKVYVLGRVANPGVVHFADRGTLLEALALAGGLPTDTSKSFLTRCMIVRGQDVVIWIDLKELLENGNMALNARLQNNDIVFIPQSDDQLAYVMGQVMSPGVIALRSRMTILDAVMTSGGPKDSAELSKVYLIRAGAKEGHVEEIDLSVMVSQGDMRKNYRLKDGDIVYVSERGISKYNYYVKQLIPSMDVIDFSISSAESFGIMAELRGLLWNQEGYVND
ncbi:MAG: sugar transporter [Spartobacteria bacterium]|nr:sugar transporter [Spartobacteria bacterium]